MEFELRETAFQNYGIINVLGYEESDKRGYLTFTCHQGTFVGVMAKYDEDVWFYKYDKRSKYND